MDTTHKENYREFELERLIFMAGPEGGEAAEPEAEEKAKKPEEAEAADEAAEKASQTPEDTEAAIEGQTAETKDKGGEAVDDEEKKTGEAAEAAGVEGAEETEGGDTDEGETAPETAETTPAGEKVARSLFQNRDMRFSILRFLAPGKDATKVDEDTFVKLATEHEDFGKILSGIQLDSETGEPKLDEKGTKALADAIDKQMGTEGMEYADRDEVGLIGGMELEDGGKLSDLLGVDGLKLISMRYEIRKSKDGKYVEIRLAGSDEDAKFQKFDPNKIEQYLDGIRLPRKDKGEKALEEFGSSITKKVRTYERAMALRDTLTGATAEGGGQSLFEKIGSIFQLMQIFKKAMENGDWQTFNDAMEDFNSGVNIAEAMKEAEGTYKSQVANIDSLSTLLAMHEKPYGPEATAMFGSGDNRIKYRIFLGDAIQEKVGQAFGAGVNISKMKSAGGASKITLTRGRRNFEVDLNTEGNTMSVFELGTDKEGKETVLTQQEGLPIAGLDSLGTVFNMAITQKPAPAPAAEGEGEGETEGETAAEAEGETEGETAAETEETPT